MEKTTALIGWVFLVIGLGMLTGGGYGASGTAAFLGRAAPAEGAVVELLGGRPRVEFRLESGEVRTFTSRLSSDPPAFEVGERVTVLYDPRNLQDARILGTFSLWFVPILLCGMGLVFAAIGGGILGYRRARRRREAELRLHGRRVQARFTAVERNTSIRVNGRSPWVITCQWQNPATGLLHVFRSRSLWFDPTPYVRVEQLTVLVDPANPKRYHVDVDFLPKVAA